MALLTNTKSSNNNKHSKLHTNAHSVRKLGGNMLTYTENNITFTNLNVPINTHNYSWSKYAPRSVIPNTKYQT